MKLKSDTISAHHSQGTLSFKFRLGTKTIVYITDNEIHYDVKNGKPDYKIIAAQNKELVKLCRNFDYLAGSVMVKNLSVNAVKKIKMNKSIVHSLLKSIKEELLFTVNYLEINFVDNSYIHELNKEYLGHDYTTDIITFNYSGENHNLDGEIFISVDEAIINARKYKVRLKDELLRLVIHGILHMLGYDDKTSADKKIMKKHENNLVAKYKNLFIKMKIEYDG